MITDRPVLITLKQGRQWNDFMTGIVKRIFQKSPPLTNGIRNRPRPLGESFKRQL